MLLATDCKIPGGDEMAAMVPWGQSRAKGPPPPPLALLDSFELDGEHLWAATIQILIADQPGRGGETSNLLWQTLPPPLLLLAGYLQQVGWSRPNRQLWDKEFTASLAQTLGSAAVKTHFPISSVVPLYIIGAHPVSCVTHKSNNIMWNKRKAQSQWCIKY